MSKTRGRPPLPKSKRQVHRVIVRLSTADLAYVRAKAAEGERTLSAYLRERGLAS
jgi:hypothetical protein